MMALAARQVEEFRGEPRPASLWHTFNRGGDQRIDNLRMIGPSMTADIAGELLVLH
jgi:hypothetical protein